MYLTSSALNVSMESPHVYHLTMYDRGLGVRKAANELESYALHFTFIPWRRKTEYINYKALLSEIQNVRNISGRYFLTLKGLSFLLLSEI